MVLGCLTTPLQVIIEQGGLSPGGLNFDCKIRRESTDLEDMFIAHIGKVGMCRLDGFLMTTSFQNYTLNILTRLSALLGQKRKKFSKIVL